MAPPHHPAGGDPFAGNPQAPSAGAPPYDQAPPHGGPPVDGVPGAPVAPIPGDPYGAPADAAGAAPAADPYGAPPADPGPPASAPPADYPAGDYPVPPAGGAPVDSAAPLNGEFAAMMQSVQRELENGQLAAALRQLTGWYGNPQLSPHEQQQLSTMLDQVAGTVVYSTQNLTENPYEVQPGERLEAIGEKYQVPWQLLAKINGIEDPAALQPGERLKVVRGPFEAIVSLERRELVLRTGDGLYAGRFPIGVGAEHPPQEGTFAVSDKVPNPVYYGRENAIGAEDPNNPLGERWIGLGKQMAIHGTNNPGNIGRTDLPGWISLREEDVAEVYDILGLGSRVTIRR
jgi:lipoprotein-anchoring transpeptidase ErfK/SrfK